MTMRRLPAYTRRSERHSALEWHGSRITHVDGALWAGIDRYSRVHEGVAPNCADRLGEGRHVTYFEHQVVPQCVTLFQELSNISALTVPFEYLPTDNHLIDEMRYHAINA
jgi:hypothetical protein